MPAKRSYIVLTLIVLLYTGIGALYAINTPPWQTPDEPAHYNYIAQIAAGGCCPVIAAGDWDSDYLEELKAEQFPEAANLSTIEYEDHQPPLYYLAATPVFLATGGDLVAVRMVSVVFGAGIVIAAYFMVARLFPRHREVGLAAAALVAFIPQHIAMMASVNNDGLAEMLLAILLVVAVTYLGNPTEETKRGDLDPYDIGRRPHAAALGGLVGAMYLTKLTVYLPATLAVAAVILLRWWRDDHDVRWLVEQVAWAAGMAIALGALWWGRNIVVYGWPDFLAQAAHNAAVVGQLRTQELIADIGMGEYVRRYLTTTYHSFWGQFGWMGVPMQPRDYLFIGAFLIADAVGLGLLLRRGTDHLHPVQRNGLIALGIVGVATVIGFIGYNLTYVQFQGRYLYPALIPFALVVAWGLMGWATILSDLLPGPVRRWLPLLALGWLPLLALFALFRYVVPNLG